MYKTVRHGENSLQYTILPQTEEVINNSGLKGKGRDYSPSIHMRRSRRKSTVKYVLLIIFGVIGALALASVPLYIMNGALLARKQVQDRHEVITSAPLAPAARELAKSRKKELKMSPELVLTLGQKSETTTASTSLSTPSTTSTTTVSTEKPIPRTMPTFRKSLWKILTSTPTKIPPLPTQDNRFPLIFTPSSIRVPAGYRLRAWEKDITITLTITTVPPIRKTFRYHATYVMPSKIPKEATTTKPFNDVSTTTKAATTKNPVTTESVTTTENNKFRDLKDTMLSVDDDDEFKESLVEDEVFSLPPLKPDYAAPGTDSDEVTVSKTGEGGWYGARWPFVDTSSYFQWTGYSPGDNLLLPLLVAALSSIALVLLLALAVRRRKRSHVASAQIGLTTDLQADDNTNLLTAENPEDPEE